MLRLFLYRDANYKVRQLSFSHLSLEVKCNVFLYDFDHSKQLWFILQIKALVAAAFVFKSTVGEDLVPQCRQQVVFIVFNL